MCIISQLQDNICACKPHAVLAVHCNYILYIYAPSRHVCTRSHTHTLHTASAVQTVYHVQKEKELPKLHRAVWKGNLDKVKKLTKSMKTSELNSTDKEKRY